MRSDFSLKYSTVVVVAAPYTIILTKRTCRLLVLLILYFTVPTLFMFFGLSSSFSKLQVAHRCVFWMIVEQVMSLHYFSITMPGSCR